MTTWIDGDLAVHRNLGYGTIRISPRLPVNAGEIWFQPDGDETPIRITDRLLKPIR